jgi:hypothetical protein
VSNEFTSSGEHKKQPAETFLEMLQAHCPHAAERVGIPDFSGAFAGRYRYKPQPTTSDQPERPDTHKTRPEIQVLCFIEPTGAYGVLSYSAASSSGDFVPIEEFICSGSQVTHSEGGENHLLDMDNPKDRDLLMGHITDRDTEIRNGDLLLIEPDTTD